MAEDNAINVRVAQGMLKKLGLQCDVVADGGKAVDAVMRGEYDVVLMDMQMPVMGGLEATRIIRAAKNVKAQPRIIAMTANAMASDREQCLEAGMDDYVSKPMKREDLKRALQM